MDADNKDENGVELANVWRFPESDASDFVEITAYIRADQALALELLENSGRKKDLVGDRRSKLIQEALDMLIKRDIVAIRVPTNKKLNTG